MKAHDKGNGSATKPAQAATTNADKKPPPAESQPNTPVSTSLSVNVFFCFILQLFE